MGSWLYRFAAAAALMAAACGGDSTASEPPANKGAPGAGAAEEPEAPPSPREGLHPWRSLLDEAGRAELEADGLLIDLGTADGHKYTIGGWETGWGTNQRDGQVSFAPMTAKTARLEMLVRQPSVGAVLVRARSAGGDATVSATLAGRKQGSAAVGTEWTVARIPVEGKVGTGATALVLDATATLDVDWVWLDASSEPREPLRPPRVAPVKLAGKLRRALVAPTSRRYSFYLHVPEQGALVFDYGSEPKVAFSVHVEPVEGQPVELFRGDGEPRWQTARVDLSAFAGQAVRLELRTEGEPALAGWGEPALATPREPERAPQGKPAKNLIVIVVDTARADAYGTVDPNTIVKTPAFDVMAEKATAFANAYNNENWTKPSVATLLSGMYPDAHDTRHRESVLPDGVELLSEHLQKQGFATGSVIANRVVSKQFGFQQGWDAFLRAVGADNVYGEAIGWLKQRDPKQRFFLYLQPFDPHIPYEVDAKYSALYYEGKYEGPLGSAFDGAEQAQVNDKKRKLSEDDAKWVRALYNGELTFHDERFGRFWTFLDEQGLLEDTLVVYTNDHGEEFLEHELLGHGWSLYETLLRAPLTMHYPPLFPAQRVQEPVEHVDVAATVLEALAVKPLRDAEGLSLMPLVRGAAARLRPYYTVSWARGLSEGRAVRVGRWKYSRGGQWAGLWDLVADPGEQTNLVGKRPIAERLGQVYLGEALATRKKTERLGDVTTARQFESVNAKLDEKTRKELEALGYFGDGQDEE